MEGAVFLCPQKGAGVTTTQTGIPIIDCDTCQHRHPITRKHCPTCGRASLFCHQENR